MCAICRFFDGPAVEGSCTPIDLDHPPEPWARGKPMANFCGRLSMSIDKGLVKTKCTGSR
jgi:hypothetical protein